MHLLSLDRGSGRVRPDHLLGALAVCGAFAFYLIWQVLHRGVYQYSTALYPFDDADEWRYTACSRLVEHGYSLFDQVFSAQPPLFFLSLASGMHVFGDSVTGARATEIIFGAVALAASAWCGWEIAGPVAAGMAALVLAVSPGFLLYAHAVEAEVPMMALVTLALALALAYRRTDRIPLLVLSGLALAAATLVKFFALEAVLPVLWLIACRRGTVRTAASAAAVFGVATGVPVLLDLVLISPARQWQQVVTMHGRAAGLPLPNLIAPTTILRQFLALDRGLTVLALAGLVVLILARRFTAAGFLAIWTIGTVVMLLIFRPLFPHHAAILSTSLAVCGGAGGGVGWEAVRQRRWIVGAPLAAACLAYLVFLPKLAHADRHSLLAPQPSALTILAAYVQHTTSPAAFVAVDNLQIADLADRNVPPPLCDPSTVRLLAGYLTPDDLISATHNYHAQLVIPLGTYASVPGYLRWVRAHYRALSVPGGGVVYRAPARG